MELLPAIDLRGGRVVRLRQGDDARRTVYGEDPAAVLEGFAAAGVARVHVVDLDAALGESAQRPLLEALGRRAAGAGLELQLGGGLRQREDVTWALGDSCFGRAVVGSMLARQPALFQEIVSAWPGRIVPALDFKDGRLAVAGWRETAELGVEALGERLRGLACPAVLVTDVARDGEMAGPNFALACEVGAATGLPALLSGGVHRLEDLRRARAMPQIGGAVVGRALYDGTFSVTEALAACAGEAP